MDFLSDSYLRSAIAVDDAYIFHGDDGIIRFRPAPETFRGFFVLWYRARALWTTPILKYAAGLL
jgi:hypothetical protein